MAKLNLMQPENKANCAFYKKIYVYKNCALQTKNTNLLYKKTIVPLPFL